MRNNMALGGKFYSPSQIGHYFLSRIPSLAPPKAGKMKHPIAVLKQLDRHQWLMFWAGFIGWTWDSFDFFTVSLTVTELAKEFNVENSEVTWGITITLMLRSVGALIFGTISDRYGRKWVMIGNLFLFIILELATGFCNTLSQFLGVRALYGIAMGGLYGPAAATALEDLPYDARGILSGFYQQGYALGYILAAVFYRALVPTTPDGWRSLFWFGAAPPVLIIAYRWYLPETNHFQVMCAEREANHARQRAEAGDSAPQSRSAHMRAFGREAGHAISANWPVLIYMIVLMTGFNSISHGSQDLYPTFLKSQAGMSATKTTVVTVVGQIGAIIGSTIIGYLSTYYGRRTTMMLACVAGGAIVPAYILPRDSSLIASTFFEQVFVGGVWGPIPVHLIELSPPALRSLTVGLTYQLGNLASSAASTIESTIGERFPLPPTEDFPERYDYGKVIAIFMGAVWAYILVFTFFGPEMSQEERNEEAAMAREYEELRARGVSLAEIGASRAKGLKPGEGPGMDEGSEEMAAREEIDLEGQVGEKAKDDHAARHVEKA